MDVQQAATIIGQPVAKLSRLQGGVNAPTYLLHLEDRKCILQIVPKRLFEKKRTERAALVLLQDSSVPTNAILDSGMLPDGRKYLVKEFLPGDLLEDLAIHGSDDEIVSTYKQLGCVLSEIHDVSFSSFGTLTLTDGSPELTQSCTDFSRVIGDELQEWISCAAQTPFARYEDALLRWVDSHVHLFAEVRPCLTHNDFAATNILVDEQEVTGVVDFDNAASGNRVYDIARIYEHGLGSRTRLAVDALLSTYRHPLPQNFSSQVSFYRKTHPLAYIDCWQQIVDSYTSDELAQMTSYMHDQLSTLADEATST